MEPVMGGTGEARGADIRFGAGRGGARGEPRRSMDEQRLDGAVMRGVVLERTTTGGLEACGLEAFGESPHALCRAQPLDDAIGEQCVDELGAGRADLRRLSDAPVAVAQEVRLRLGRQMLTHGAARAGDGGAQVLGDEAVVLEDRQAGIGGAHPQPPPDQGEGGGVQALGELQVAIAVQARHGPDTEIRSDDGQRPEQRPLARETLERRFTGRAMQAYSCHPKHPEARCTIGSRAQARVIAHLGLSMSSRPGTPPNHSNARRWQPSQVATLWSKTNSTY